MRLIPADSHVLVDFTFWQIKEPSNQEPVIAIQDHATLLPSSPCPLIHPKLPGSFLDRPPHRPTFGKKALNKALRLRERVIASQFDPIWVVIGSR